MEWLWLNPLRLALVASVLDNNSHPLTTVIVGEVPQHPDAGMIHLHKCRHALGCAQPEDGHLSRCRNRIAVERHHPECVAWQCQASDFCRARVEHVEQDPLPLLHPNGVAVLQESAIDAEQSIVDFEALCFLLGGVVRRLAQLLEFPERSSGQGVHRHVSAAAEDW
jgi:hypothetical protein